MGKKKGGVRIKQMGPKGAGGMPPGALMNPMEALQIPPDEMVHLPPPPDRKYQVFWPIRETFSMDTKSFQVIYPSYLDSTKSIKQGRRISAEKAVATPTVMDMSQALQSMSVRHVLQPYKGYSRDITCQWDNPGRLLVDVSRLKKKEIMLELAERIPTLHSRIQRLEAQKAEEERKRQEQEEAAAAAVAAADSRKTTVSGSNNKKKGKKGKKK